MRIFNTKHDPRDEFETKKVANNEGGLLSRLFRTILHDTGKVNIIGLLIQRYLDRQHQTNAKAPNIVKVRNKATMLANAKLDSMSIKVFFSLLRDLLCIRWIRLTIELEWPDGKTTVHQVESKLNNSFELEETEEGNLNVSAREESTDQGVTPSNDK